jgi:nitrite reductase/ring-hydroxylating ferredoxin subunit
MKNMDFVKVASIKDLSPDKMIGVKAEGNDVLIANLAGKYYAIGNKCTHRGCKLSEGKLKDGNITCPCHSSVFDVKTGKILHGPAKNPTSVYQVKVEVDQILVKT